MSDTGPLRSTTARDAVVRPLALAAERTCVRPGCPAPARATLSFRYDSREAWIERLAEAPDPSSYDLCASHATRTQAPHGWQLRDRRPRDERHDEQPPVTPAGLGGEDTVALLAAALRSVPEAKPDADPGAEAAEELPPPDLHAEVAGAAPSPDPAPDAGTDRVGPEAPEATTSGAGPLEDSTSPVLEPSRTGRTSAPRSEPPTAGRGDAGPRAAGASEETMAPEAPEEAGAPAAAGAMPRPVPAARDRAVRGERERGAVGPAGHW